MWYFALRMALIAFIAFIGLICVNVGTFGPMFTGHILLAIAVIWLVLEFIAAVEQIVNAYKASQYDDTDIDDRDPY